MWLLLCFAAQKKATPFVCVKRSVIYCRPATGMSAMLAKYRQLIRKRKSKLKIFLRTYFRKEIKNSSIATR